MSLALTDQMSCEIDPRMAVRHGRALWCLCIFGFLKEFRPSQSFLTPYLEGPSMNFTQEEVNQEIYPIGTYSTLLVLIVVFLITDILRYKPVIIVHSIAGVICYCLLTFGTAKFHVQASEVVYGLFMASEVAYYTYMYASCEKDLYQSVTSYTRAALQTGRLVSDSLAQLLISTDLLDFFQLNYLSIAGLSCSSVFAFLLPSTSHSLYFHRFHTDRKSEVVKPTSSTFLDTTSNSIKSSEVLEYTVEPKSELYQSIRSYKIHSGLQKIFCDFTNAFSNSYVTKWSLWWAFTQCGYLQVSYYVQNLWQDTSLVSGDHPYNGAASAVYTILAVLASWLIGLLGCDFTENKSLWLLSMCSLFSGALITSLAISTSLVFQYIAYGSFKILFQVMMIFANSEVAKSLSRDTQGLIFGFNTFIALLLQTILTVTVAGKGGLELPIRLQFFVYAGYYVTLGSGFLVIAIITSVKISPRHQHHVHQTVSNEAQFSAIIADNRHQ